MMAEGNMSVPKGDAARGDRIEPKDLVRLFVRQWKWAAATFVIAALVIIAFLSRIPPQWEAQATVKLGEVYDALTNGIRPIEPLQELLERTRAKPFLREALKGAGISPDLPSESLFLGSTRIDPIPSTALIRITSRGFSPEETRQFVQAIFDRLKPLHEKSEQQARFESERLVAEYTEELAGLREVRANLEKALSSASGLRTDDGQVVQASIAGAIEKNSREIRDLERQRYLLVRRTESQFAPTMIIGQISLVRAASTSRSLIVAFGIVIGLAAGLLVAVLRDYLGRLRSEGGGRLGSDLQRVPRRLGWIAHKRA